MTKDWKVNDLADVKEAAYKISDYVESTRLSFSPYFSNMFGSFIYFKRENEQKTCSFKVRGVFNKLLNVPKDLKIDKIVACSMGNHAQGVAYASQKMGFSSVVVMPELCSEVKVKATLKLGTQVVLYGNSFDKARQHSLELAQEPGTLYIPPYEDPYVVAGQGTIGLEILKDLPDLDSIVVPVGGGGLISGIALVAKKINPKIKVYGVVCDRFPSYKKLMSSSEYPLGQDNLPPGHAVMATLADGIALKSVSPLIYESYISKYVDDIISVSERSIGEAICALLAYEKTLAEGAAALPLAALNSFPNLAIGKKCALILSGGNIDLKVLSRVLLNYK